MAAIINSTYKTFCGVEDTEMRKTQSYLGYYESLELRKEVETTKNNRSSSRESTEVDELFKENEQNEKKHWLRTEPVVYSHFRGRVKK